MSSVLAKEEGRAPDAMDYHRLMRGQFYTPAPLCDLMLALTLRDSDRRLLDPGCGPGIFLLRAAAWFQSQQAQSVLAIGKFSPKLAEIELDSASAEEKDRHTLLGMEMVQTSAAEHCKPRLLGIEIDPASAEQARQNLQDGSDSTISAAVITADFLSLSLEAGEPNGDFFDVIIGNPPYVRQEHLAQAGHMDKRSSLSALQEKYADYLAQFPEQRVLFSGATDLYILFFLQAATLLKPGGRLTFVTSNSWLNASFGQAFRRFLQHHFHIRALVESAVERWFPDAAINGLVLLLERKEDGQPSTGEPPVRMLRFHEPLAQWLPDPASPDYWAQLSRQLIRFSTENALPTETLTHFSTPSSEATLISSENTLPIKTLTHVRTPSPQTSLISSTHNHEADAISLRCVPQEHLKTQGPLANWGLLQRAPREITEWLAQLELSIPLEQLGQVRYPLKTGINRFFYLSPAEAEKRGIEPEFLRPVAKSLRNIKRYGLRASDCETLLFCCPWTQEELEAQGKTGALAYVRWGETQMAAPRQKRAHPVPWPQVASVQGHHPWYAIKPLPPAHLLCSRFLDQRFLFPLCEGDLIEDQTFYGLTLTNPQQHPPMLIAALLNSTLSFTLLEFNARTSLGEGVLQYARCDMAAFPLIHPDLYNASEQCAIMEAFAGMRDQVVLPVAEELQRPERIRLDRLILAPLLKRWSAENDGDAFREALASALRTRMAERRAMAQMHRRRGR